MFREFKEQRGSTSIVFVLLIIVLFGFLGLVYDVGNIFYQKQKLQDGIDFAALSGTQSIKDGASNVVSEITNILIKEGIDPANVTINYPYNGDNYKVEVTSSKTINLYFLPIFGYNTKTVSARAVGGVSVDYLTLLNDIALNYAVFSSSTEVNLQIKGNGSSVHGNIHSNDDIEIYGNNHFVDGNVTADEDIRVQGSWTVTGTIQDWDQVLPIPTIDFDKYASYAENIVDGNVLYNGDLNIDGIWLINGDCHLSGQRISGKGILLVTGSLTISGGTQYATGDDLLAIHVGGDIDVSAAGADIVGALFAPNGEIRINGSGNTFFGALIADRVFWATQDLTINGVYDNRVTTAFTVEQYKYLLFE